MERGSESFHGQRPLERPLAVHSALPVRREKTGTASCWRCQAWSGRLRRALADAYAAAAPSKLHGKAGQTFAFHSNLCARARFCSPYEGMPVQLHSWPRPCAFGPVYSLPSGTAELMWRRRKLDSSCHMPARSGYMSGLFALFFPLQMPRPLTRSTGCRSSNVRALLMAVGIRIP